MISKFIYVFGEGYLFYNYLYFSVLIMKSISLAKRYIVT